LALATHALEKATEANYTRGIATATRYVGVAHALLSNFEESLRCLNRALELFNTLGAKLEAVAVRANIGATYQKMGQFDVALQWQLEVLPLAHELRLPEVEANTLSNIAEIYMETRQFSLALDYEQRSIEIRERIDDQSGIAFGLGAIGRVYLGMDRVEKAIEYYERSLNYARRLNDKASLAYTLRGLGEAYRRLGRAEDSIAHFEEALKHFRDINDPQLISENELMMAKALVEVGELEAAEQLGRHALDLATGIQDVASQAEAHVVLSEVAAHRGDYENALGHHRRFTQMKVEALERASQQNLTFLEARYQFESNAHEQEIFKLKNVGLSQALAEIEEKARKIEAKNQDLQNSMQYAQRVQQAILHGPEHLAAVLKNSYVFHRPKDYVSGDFFWVGKVDNTILVALADCTGTGIPAALLSVIGHHLLNDIVYNRNTITPAKILGQLHTAFRKTLHQNTPRGVNSTDSLDIGVISLNPISNEMNYAGAFQNLFMMKRGLLEEIKGDRYSVGGHQEEAFRIYTNHRLVLQGNEQFILLSDGLPNQVGGDQGKRFTSKRLREMLELLATLPFEQQRQTVERIFDDWRGNHDSTDDVLLVSFKI
jgi:tetratricopeptide (TPR) repeat protein/serine phosphatase RsbU (regulator of sigma subunit)